jgi:hypothetical protein
MYCKKEIEMSDRAAGQWLPYEPEGDGNLHDCRVKKDGKKGKVPEQEKHELKTVLEAQVFLEGIDARVKRIEKMLFIERT